MDKLKPCPFCGGEAESIESGPSGKENVTHWQVRCKKILSNCMGSEIDTWRVTRDDAIEAWNTRATNWISVEDLPEDNLMVIDVWSSRINRRLENMPVGLIRSYLEGGDRQITHWMPLPAPPEGE